MKLKSFSLDFTVSDNAEFIKNQERWLKVVEDMMRDEGYTPFIDIPAQYNTVLTNKGFNIEVTLFGALVGEKSWELSFVDAGMATRGQASRQLSIQSNRQRQFSKQ